MTRQSFRTRVVVAAAALLFTASAGSASVHAAQAPQTAPGSSQSPAAAETDEDALIRHGLELRRRGEDAAALPYFERAYRASASPRAAAQLGFAEQALGRWNEADAHVTEALRANNDPWIKKNQRTIRDAQKTIRAHTAASSTRPTATATASPNGERRTSHAERRTEAPATSAASSTSAQDSSAIATAPPSLAEGTVWPFAPATSDDTARSRHRTAGFALMAAGAAVVGLGVSATFAKGDADNYDRWKAYDAAATGLYVIGGAAIVTGAILYRTSGHAGQEEKGERGTASVATVPRPRSAAVQPYLGGKGIGAALSMPF